MKFAEEVEDPRRTVPRGLLVSAAIVLVVYLLVAIAAVSALGVDRLADSPGPLAEIMRAKAGGGWATAIVVVALFATSKSILSNVIGASRLVFDVARDTGYRWLAWLDDVNASTRTPAAATVLVTLLAIGFGTIGDLKVVAAMSNVFIMLVFLAVNGALLKIRRESDEVPPFEVPGSIGPYPVTAILAMGATVVLLGLNVVVMLGIR